MDCISFYDYNANNGRNKMDFDKLMSEQKRLCAKEEMRCVACNKEVTWKDTRWNTWRKWSLCQDCQWELRCEED